MILHATTRLATDERASVGPMFALMLTPLVMVLGISVDYARGTAGQQHLQATADSAVLAAAAMADASDAQRIERAKTLFDVNALRRDWVKSTMPNGILAPNITIADGSISINANGKVPTTFTRIGGIESIPVIAKASASLTKANTNARACVLALESSDRGLLVNGGASGSHISATCGVYANSISRRAIFGNGNGSITSTFTCVGGDYDTSLRYTPTPTRNCPAMADPFASLPAPDSSGCTFRNFRARGVAVLQPGVYCGGIDIVSDSRVVFTSGTYVIKDGAFKIGSHATAESSPGGVFFYLTGNNARVQFTSHAEVKFKALSTGTYKGVLLYHDRNAHLSNDHEFGSKSSSILQGAIYSPSTGVQITSSGSVYAQADWSVWVVKRLQLSSTAHLSIQADYTNSETPLPDLISGSQMTYGATSARLVK